MKNLKLNIISKVPTKKETQFLEDRIHEHNAAQINRDDGKLFSKLIIYDSQKEIVAGITGWTWAGACEIALFWVKHDYRNKGYGKSLLNAADTEAVREKCKAIFLRTYSFQAPGFYKKHGYTVEHEIKDFPPGHHSFSLIKRLGSLMP